MANPEWTDPMDWEDCPGHVASKDDAKVCGNCGCHIDSLRPDEDLDEGLLS